MSPDNLPTPSKVCPTCGTRLSENATRCVVCGSEFSASIEVRSQNALRPSQMPEVTLSLPVALGLLVIFLAAGAGLVFLANSMLGVNTAPVAEAPTVTETPTVTLVPTETPTPMPTATYTPLPPVEYTVNSGDTCVSIALFFNVSVQSIILLNNLPTACNTLFIGQKLLVPQATPTPLPEPSATLLPMDATRAACQKVVIDVQANDTLSKIAATYNVPMDAIKSYNGLSTDVVYLGMRLTIPLCERAPTPGPTPTATIPPPYPAPGLLLPADGAAFAAGENNLAVQWSSIGILRENESYMLVIEDITGGDGRRLVVYTTETRYVIPASFRPNAELPHVFRWSVVTVRQSGTDEQGQIVWVNAGARSEPRVFSWQGNP
jgi:LysM repeat protein